MKVEQRNIANNSGWNCMVTSREFKCKLVSFLKKLVRRVLSFLWKDINNSVTHWGTAVSSSEVLQLCCCPSWPCHSLKHITTTFPVTLCILTLSCSVDMIYCSLASLFFRVIWKSPNSLWQSRTSDGGR